MLRALIAITLFFSASTAKAGDYLEDYFFFIIAAFPSELSVEIDTDTASSAFRNRVTELSREWSEKCGARVDIWHTNLMDNEDTPWTPDLWFAFIGYGETRAELKQTRPPSDCGFEGYVKQGSMVIPTVYQMCAAPEEFGMPEAAICD